MQEVIILAGGLGTRLKSAVPTLPKCMAPINGLPFLHYVMTYLQTQKIDRFVFSLGYMSQIIEDWVLEHFAHVNIAFSVEEAPLGTGGGVQAALEYCNQDHVWVVNGDTLFTADLQAQFNFHLQSQSCCTLALKSMQNFDRYGVVKQDAEGRILSFEEKKAYEKGLINGGVYLLNKKGYFRLQLPKAHSFENDYLNQVVHGGKLFGISHDAYFIDIGIPSDYEKAQHELPQLGLIKD
ncbi:MAG: nucleotidyltransferase family protein [Hydrotalea sp.]|nr:nucleotidyltransferase family protein [Hydrotalea sp.]